MTKFIIVYVLHVLAIVGLFFIVDYKRPYELNLINWSTKEKIIVFLVALVCLTILKIYL